MGETSVQQCLWPPQCCVAAFINSAIILQGYKHPNPTAIPLFLGCHVGPDDHNPFNLPITLNDKLRGLTISAALKQVPQLFHAEELPLEFHYVPFREVPFRLYDELLRTAIDYGLSVGIGLDISLLGFTAHTTSANHLLRVTSSNEDQVAFTDDSGECIERSFTRSWDIIERAVLAVDNGFWLVGLPDKITSIKKLL